MTRTRLAVACAAALALPFALPADEKEPPFKLSADEKAVVEFTNAERKKAELPPLAANPKLTAAARGHAANMAKQDKLEHTLDDKKFDDRITAAGYKFAAAGENIAWNPATPKEVVAGWMDSPPHKANIENKDFTEIGIGVAKNEKGEPYWVQVFGKPLE